MGQTSTYDPRSIATLNDKSAIKQHLEEARKVHKTIVEPVLKFTNKFQKIQADVKALLDEYERPGKVASLTFDAVQKQIENIVGPISSHPFMKWHKIHFEALITIIKASSSAERAQRNFDAAYKLAERIQNDGGAVLDPYRKGKDKFNAFEKSMNPVYVGAFFLRGSIESDVNQRKISGSTLKSYHEISSRSGKVHQTARDSINEIFETYVALHQSLGMVVSLTIAAEKDLNKMRSEKGTFRGMSKNLATIAESATNFSMTVNSDGKLNTDNLDVPIRDAINDTEKVINDWLEADDKFTKSLYKLDVFAALKNK